jgi:hypothetical protein
MMMVNGGHIQAMCKGDCGPYGCNLCNLFICAVCKEGEGGLPTHCPGEPIPYDIGQQIYHGEIDYIDGQWIKLEKSHD